MPRFHLCEIPLAGVGRRRLPASKFFYSGFMREQEMTLDVQVALQHFCGILIACWGSDFLEVGARIGIGPWASAQAK